MVIRLGNFPCVYLNSSLTLYHYPLGKSEKNMYHTPDYPFHRKISLIFRRVMNIATWLYKCQIDCKFRVFSITAL